MIDSFIDRIICGDCLEILDDLPDNSIDLIVTDPPYRIHADKGSGILKNRKFLTDIKEKGLDEFEPQEFISKIFRIQPFVNAYIFCSKNLLRDYIEFAMNNNLNWDILIMGKNNPIPTKNNKYLPDLEFIFFTRERGATFNNLTGSRNYDLYRKVKIVNRSNETIHPTEKPVGLVGDLIKVSSKENDIVLDPFAGSGTTLLASKRLGRRYIGIEKEKSYCEMSEKRLKQEELF